MPALPGGLESYSLIGAATTNAQVVKPSAGVLYGWFLSNINAQEVYLKVYDKKTAADENDTPKLRILIPGGATGLTSRHDMTEGVTFDQGIAIRLVVDAADNGTTAPSAAEQLVNLMYQ